MGDTTLVPVTAYRNHTLTDVLHVKNKKVEGSGLFFFVEGVGRWYYLI